MIVGVAEVVVRAATGAFERELRDQTAPAFDGVRKDAQAAGAGAGADLRAGVKGGAAGLEGDLAAMGASGGAGLRHGVTEETGKLAGDVERDGARAGDGLHKGFSGGLQKLASAISAVGIPVGGLADHLERTGSAAEHADSKGRGLAGTLHTIGGAAVVGIAGAAVAVGAIGVHLAETMQTADTAIATAQGTSIAAGKAIGDSFLGTAGKTEFSAQEMAKSFASVAGQLKATEGRALSQAQAMQVMSAADDLATAKQIDLGTATSTIASVMQAFGLRTHEAGHAADVLYVASNATGQSVDALGAQLVKVRGKLGETGGSIGDLSALLVDMTERGITGRAAMSALNGGMNTLEKSATGVQAAISTQKAAYDQMDPALRSLADRYTSGALTASQFTKATGQLPPAQAELAKQFATASVQIQTAQLKYKELGVTVFDARGQFIGMGSIIDQLHPKFAKMTQQQQLAAAATLFGSGAARQMTEVINAGSQAYNTATAAVNKHGAAQTAAATQSHTLHVEEATLKAEMGDLATKVGTVLVPVLTTLVGWFVKGTTFVVDHKAALIVLAGVITGILGPAIAVWGINKMAAFGRSFTEAGGHVKSFAGDVQTAVSKVIGLLGHQSDAADSAAGKIATSTQAAAGSVATEETEIASSTAGIDTSFASTATAADAAKKEIGIDESVIAGEVATADTAIEAENAAAGGSFGALAGAGGAGLLSKLARGLAKGVPIAIGLGLAQKGIHAIDPSGAVGPGSSSGVGNPNVGAGNPGPINTVLGELGLPHLPSLSSIVSSLNPFGGETYAQQQYNISHDTGGPTRLAKAHTDLAAAAVKLTGAFNMSTDAVSAHAASAGLPGFSPSQDAVARQLMAIFTAGGLSKAGSAGLVGNAAQESSLNPTEPGGLLFQWQGSRLAAEQAFAAAHHESPTSVAAEGGFALQELKGYPQLLSDLQAATNPRAAADEISNVYERPNAAKANLPNREQQAAAALAAFGNAGAGASSAPTGTYLDPFYRASGVVRGRTDQGVDYGFSGPLGAVGPGIIEAVKQFAGFGTTIEERLTSGPEKGKLIYTALENGATLLAHAGERVRAGTAIAQGLGRGGIEMGFAQGSGPEYGLPVTRYGAGQSHDIPTSGGIAFSNFLAEVKTGAALGGGASAGNASLAMTVAQEKAALNTEIAREKAAVAAEILKLRESVKGKGVSTEEKTKVAGDIAALRSALAVQIAQQRGALSTQTAAQKAELAKQTTDLKAGTSTLGKLLSAIHSGSLKTLQGLLDSTHNRGLQKLEASLDHDHSAALASLSAQLVKVHREAMDRLAEETAAAAAKAAAAAETSLLNRESTDLTRTATDQATQIADATRVLLDQQAAAGLSGLALVAANDQIALDQTTQASDAAIAGAQAAVDAAASGTALQQAQAANQLAQAQAAATVAQAQAQSTLDIANAAAQRASSTSSTSSTTSTTTTNAPMVNLNIFGTAGMSEAELMRSLGFAVRTGALPLAPVTPGG